MDVLIVGYGVVGSNLARELSALKPEVVDKYKPNVSTKSKTHYNVAFICVDTPITDKSLCDTTEVYNAIQENNADLYVIKSTVSVGATRAISEKTGKHIVFSPEYYGGTQHCNNFSFNFTIVGGEREDCKFLVQLLQNVYDARHRFEMTDYETAELVKYMENSFLATKVAFCIQFFEIAKKFGVDYEELRELFILDPRVNPSHTFVYDEHPFYKSHCLDKDVPSIADQSDAELLKSVIAFNNSQKKKYQK